MKVIDDRLGGLNELGRGTVGINQIEAPERGIEVGVTQDSRRDHRRCTRQRIDRGIPIQLKHGLGLNNVLGTIHIYPTMMEANKYLAGEWSVHTSLRG